MKFNEDSRVKIPALLHLIRLGFTYLSLKQASWDTDTNIFGELFERGLLHINPGATQADVQRALQEVQLSLGNQLKMSSRTCKHGSQEPFSPPKRLVLGH